MDRLFLLEKSMVEDKTDPDGVILQHEIAHLANRSCDRWKIADIASEDGFRDEITKHQGSVIPVGTLPFVRMYLEAADAQDKTMLPIEIPESMRRFAGREYFIASGSELLGTDYIDGSWFVKDVSVLKYWNSLLYNENLSMFIKPEHRYSVSKYMKILSEYRIFIFDDRVMSVQHYSGDPLIFPDRDRIMEMVYAYTDEPHPKAYTLDIAVVAKNNRRITVPLEVHSFVSCGLYGFQHNKILDMLEEGIRWYAGRQNAEMLALS